MEIAKYVVAPGSHISPKKVQAYGEYLHELHDEFDGLTARLVVEEASDSGSSIHDWFEWNDTVAARSWREEQARRLIRGIHVSVTMPDGKEVTTRAFQVIRFMVDVDE